MKHLLLLLLLGLPLGASGADSSFSRSVDREQQQRVERRNAVMRRADVNGVVARGLRGGNPFQMLNPNAPARYGTAEESIMYDPYTGKWNGIRFLTIYFD